LFAVRLGVDPELFLAVRFAVRLSVLLLLLVGFRTELWWLAPLLRRFLGR
jgi:hypothetical protein